MSKVYAATGIEKLVADFDPEHGASMETRCTMNDRINIQAGSLAELIDAICKEYALDRKDFVGPGLDDGEGIDNLNFITLECADCSEPSDVELEEWKAGRLKLYCCDYHFSIEKRTVSNVDASEFEGLTRE